MSKWYELIEVEESEFWGVRITDEESNFHDLQVLYGRVTATVLDEKDGSAQLSFEYDVIDNPWNADTESDECQDLLGSTLEDILHEALETGKYRIGNEPGTDNNSKSDQE